VLLTLSSIISAGPDRHVVRPAPSEVLGTPPSALRRSDECEGSSRRASSRAAARALSSSFQISCLAVRLAGEAASSRFVVRQSEIHRLVECSPEA